jgi:hypothetical protein
LLRFVATLCLFAGGAFAADRPSAADPNLGDLIKAIRVKSQSLENTFGMKQGFQSFLRSNGLREASVKYSDFVTARLLFEATRDAGLWNLRWTITNREPVSDNIWKQWRIPSSNVSALKPTATAECDELSALYAFLGKRAGVRGIGLLWPTYNHTVAVWVISPPNARPVRIVVPATQIFLTENDFFGTRHFDPWKQKSIHEYSRVDIPDSFTIPQPLFDYFLRQIDRYAGASNTTLQRLRYLREGIFYHKARLR